MPISIIKNSVEYSIHNRFFFINILILLFLVNFFIGLLDVPLLSAFVTSLIMMGYGLQMSEDIINGGTRLPKLIPRKILSYGIKGNIVSFVYFFIQSFLLSVICVSLHFPVFEIEEFVLNYGESMALLSAHDPVSFAVFIISSLIIVYVLVFFMELALARLADGGKLKNAFNIVKIKHAIDIIGWREYTIEYTKIILSILILTYIVRFEIPVVFIDSVFDAVLTFLIFVIEYVGIGHIYKVYKIKKEAIE